MNVIKINMNNNKKKVCCMPQNSTISQLQHMKLLSGVGTMVATKYFLLYQVHYQTTVK